jgi:translation initiation factor 2B subunit (eIF-2B alpha/beta/delta family)
MGNSKLRGGKKAHKKRVAVRNQNIKTKQTAMQKLFNETMKQQLEELKKQRETEMSGETETTI